jgi:hypothetical protein
VVRALSLAGVGEVDITEGSAWYEEACGGGEVTETGVGEWWVGGWDGGFVAGGGRGGVR